MQANIINNIIKLNKALKKTLIIFIFIFILFILCIFNIKSILAEDNMSEAIYSLYIDEATIKRGYEIKGFKNKFQVAISPYVLKYPTKIELKDRTKIFLIEKKISLNTKNGDIILSADERELFSPIPIIGDNLGNDLSIIASSTINNIASSSDEILLSSQNGASSEIINNEGKDSPSKINEIGMEAMIIKSQAKDLGKIPEGWEVNSEIYEFDLKNKEAFVDKIPFIVTINYLNDTNNKQSIFYFDENKKEWELLLSSIDYNNRTVRAVILLPYAKMAVFENMGVPCKGIGSWYKYKGCNCAASPDYPKGTKLKVTNLYNNKSVIITVNDYGPDRSVHPDRVIDLDVEAFKAIAKKGAGLIDVKVEPINEIYSYAFQEAKHPTAPVPEIKAKYAAVIDEATGEMLYGKNEKASSSIASITKLMTAHIFMEKNFSEFPDIWNKVIKYDKSDDLEGSKLYVNDGETMLIKDIFYSMLVGSANNAAKILVRYSGLSEKEFVERMNQKANEWGLENTIFSEPSGLNPENKSTALELAKMAKNIFKNFEMLKSTTLHRYSFKTINTEKSHTIKATNELLFDKDLYITGAKTGYLDEVGYCLIVKAKNKNDGREIIGVVLGENSSEERFEDMKKLIVWGLGE